MLKKAVFIRQINCFEEGIKRYFTANESNEHHPHIAVSHAHS